MKYVVEYTALGGPEWIAPSGLLTVDECNRDTFGSEKEALQAHYKHINQFGVQRTPQIYAIETQCDECGGTGTYPDCGGEGYLDVGTISLIACSTCLGTQYCPTCDGSGGNRNE